MAYLGSKAGCGTWQTILAAMPPHDTYIETHLGSGVVLLRKPACARSIAVELDALQLDSFRSDNPDVLSSVELVNADAGQFLQEFDFSGAGRTLVYADPPYLVSTRSARARYRMDYTEADHRQLLSLLATLPCAVMISGYPSELYDATLSAPRWRSHAFQAMTRGGVRTEVLWMNFPAGAVHWASLAGRNFGDRQRIKRKAARWAAKYRALPPAERQAVLAALLATGAD